jgi:2-oxo-3-hexenedioate decarboxylase
VPSLQETVADARRRRVVVEAPSGDDATLADGYRIQAALFGAAVPAAYKLGLVSIAKREQMKQDRPVYGRVSRSMISDQPVVPLARLIQPRFEPEVAVVLASDIAPRSTPGAIHRAIGATVLAVDVLDSIWSGYAFSLPQVVADNTSGGMFVLGHQAYDQVPAGHLTAHLDGELVAAGDLSEIGDPIANLQWLATDVGGLLAGQTVFLGSPAAAVAARPGLLEIEGPGGYRLDVRFVDELP